MTMIRTFSLALLGMSALAGLSPAAPPQQPPAPAYKLPRPTIPADFPIPGKNLTVHGVRLHYVEAGSGRPVLFLHGNPTSSYLWRNVIPYVQPQARAIALDLVGMGGSGKPDIAYTFADHYRFVEGFIEALNLRDLTLVVHDWGAALGFEYARRHPDNVRGIAFMEGVLPPTFPQPSFEAMGEEMGGMFRAFKDAKKGVELVIDNHLFVEKVLPGFVNRTLGDTEMAAYRAPYVDKTARKPLLAWPRQVPIAGEPADVVQAIGRIGEFMQSTDKPLLLLYATPGVLVPPAAVAWYTQHLRNVETVFVGQGFHFIQEDQPEAIGRAVADWMRRHRG